MADVKTCTKCGNVFPATLEYFYKNSGGKYGITPRCKTCVNVDNWQSHQKRLADNPEQIKAQATARTRKHYYKDVEKSRQKGREYKSIERQDPLKNEIIKARKRGGGAGLTPEEIHAIRINQNNKCAICGDLNPTDLDHCHDSGDVRWLLCKHCNRGLGAFRDSPKLLRQAAHLLEHRHE